MPIDAKASIDSSIDMGGGSSPSPFLGGVLNFWEPGDILTGLKGVLLVVPDVLTELGLAMLNPFTVGGGVANLLADSEILLPMSAKNCSSFSSVVISLFEEPRLLDQGDATNCSRPGEVFIEGVCKAAAGARYKDGEAGDLDWVLNEWILLPPLVFGLSLLI